MGGCEEEREDGWKKIVYLVSEGWEGRGIEKEKKEKEMG